MTRADLDALPAAPVLAVEVLSPSTRHIDLGLELRRYENAGCPSSWVVDPGTADRPPSLTARELRDDAYARIAHVVAEQSCDLDLPFRVTVVPAALLDRRRSSRARKNPGPGDMTQV